MSKLINLVFLALPCLFIIGSNDVQSDTFSASEVAIIKSFSARDIRIEDTTNKYANNIEAKKLGKTLFFEKRLSSNAKFSCASCHDFDKGLADEKAFPITLGIGKRNTPTLINTALNRWFFWDGRADSLWSQAFRPIESQSEMGGNWAMIRALFLSDHSLFTAYNRVFQEYPLKQKNNTDSFDLDRFKTNIGKAIAAFEMDLIQFNAPFDKFISDIENERLGSTALSQEEKKGLKIFIGKGKCSQCHTGPNLSDGEFHSIRLPSAAKKPDDGGRFNVVSTLKNDKFNTLGLYSDDKTLVKTKYLKRNSNQWAAFKTPTLRNIAQTAPYMHDASFESLEAVVEHYSEFKNAPPNHHKSGSLLSPLNLTDEESHNLVAFLKSLTGTISVPQY